MCGRYSLSTPAAVLAEHFGLEPAGVPALVARYNVAPSQPVPVVRRIATGAPRTLDLLRWGLLPAGARDPALAQRLVNARGETVHVRPAFRDAFRRRRCLLPADGFYEWATEDGRRRPYHVRLREGGPFAMAGLWERWASPGGPALETCAVLTTEPNPLVRAIHDRMPVILSPSDYDAWLDPGADPGRLRALLGPFPAEAMEAHPVGLAVNDPRHEGPELVRPVTP